MTYFRANNSIKRKSLFSLTILGIFAIGLFLFFRNKDAFNYYKTYYFISYFYVVGYKLSEVANMPKVLHVSGISTSTEEYAQSVPVLLYHGVLGGDIGSTGEATNINLSNFWDQMKTLKDNGWQTITMQDFYDYMEGAKKLPPKSFLLTFDDGRKDSYYPADPILKTLGFHAVMFVIDQYSLEEDSNYYLSKKELSRMAQSPQWEIQSHGYSSHSEYPIDDLGNKGHFFSNKLWLPDQNRLETVDEFIVRTSNDLQLAKNNLEEAFGKPIIAFAFPFGDYGENDINFPDAEKTIVPVAEHIYPLSFYQYSSIYRYSQNYTLPEDIKTKDGILIHRIGISYGWKGKDLLSVFEKGKAKELPFTANFSDKDGWINTNWGIVDTSQRKINLAALPDSTGSTVVLDGSNSWQDYEITAGVNWIKGSNIYLEARYRDDNNLAACNFGKNLVHVEQVWQGENRVIAGIENNFNPGNSTFTVGMRVKGRTVECLINGDVIVSSPFLEEPLFSGGIGIKIWDSIPGNSQLIINNLTVKPI
jgi:biofilm PGA synthesis lipoprotein PgaB